MLSTEGRGDWPWRETRGRGAEKPQEPPKARPESGWAGRGVH